VHIVNFVQLHIKLLPSLDGKKWQCPVSCYIVSFFITVTVSFCAFLCAGHYGGEKQCQPLSLHLNKKVYRRQTSVMSQEKQ
jgi:hypothetical protein